jgi:hypothetical protein
MWSAIGQTAKICEPVSYFMRRYAMQHEEVILIASGDLRISANQTCWPAQAQAEEAVTTAIRGYGRSVRRGHPYDPVQQHGFIHSQRHGIEVFRQVPPEARSSGAGSSLRTEN